jgi:hypothetical protein
VFNCTFSQNSGYFGGGGMANGDNSKPTVTNCRFTENSVQDWGGGMYNKSSSPTIANCIFSGNRAGAGGGMFNHVSSPALTNCTFGANSARYDGDGMFNWDNSDPTATNCIFWGDTAPNGSQIHNNDGTSSATVSYSYVQGSWPGEGNIDADPLFVDADNDDYHLLPTSPCIDAGDPNYEAEPYETDLDGRSRVIGVRIDMGAYESDYIEVAMRFTPQALNLGSKGKWLKAHFVLPEGFSPNDVDTNTPAVIAPLGIESDHMNVFINEEELVEIEAAFSRSDFCSSAISDDDTEVIVIGLLKSGRNFYGTDTIKVMDRSFEYLTIFVPYWRETNCSSPEWCADLDLDQDSVVNFVDFAMFENCCIEAVRD